jgi:hypothetical protein
MLVIDSQQTGSAGLPHSGYVSELVAYQRRVRPARWRYTCSKPSRTVRQIAIGSAFSALKAWQPVPFSSRGMPNKGCSALMYSWLSFLASSTASLTIDLARGVQGRLPGTLDPAPRPFGREQP